jgi:predicted dehydrogenase
MTMIRLGIIGAGAMARHHIQQILKQTDTTQITAICEPNKENYHKAAELFERAGHPVPPCEPDFDKFLKKYAKHIDAGFIITPHNQHFPQAKALLEAGKDVLVEKPMVINAKEAKRLIKVRDKSGRVLAVAFNGSMSPTVRKAAEMLRSGEMGAVLTVSANVWQEWEQFTRGQWRQDPKISGGGFMFDTGAHLLNTVADVLGEPFTEVAAFIDKRQTKVDILTVAIARTASGALITIHGCGAAPVTDSDVKVFCENGVIQLGVWGDYLKVQMRGEPHLKPVELPPSLGVWETFVRVLRGEIENPSPAENGLRMVQLWDAIKKSAKQGGELVEV